MRLVRLAVQVAVTGHFSRSQAPRSLTLGRRHHACEAPREIDTLRHEGYHFVTVTQLLGYGLLYK